MRIFGICNSEDLVTSSGPSRKDEPDHVIANLKGELRVPLKQSLLDSIVKSRTVGAPEVMYAVGRKDGAKAD